MLVLFCVNLGLFVNSSTVLLEGDRVNNDWHKTVINSTKLATLPVESSCAIKAKANLIQAPRYGIHLNSQSGDRSAVQYICSSNNNASVRANRQNKPVINF